MYSNMKFSYFSAYSGYNMLSGRGSASTQNLLGCTLRYLKYICSLNLMCLIHSFITFIFTCSPTDNLKVMSAIIMLCSG